MTDPKRIHDALEQIASEAVPEDTNLWQRIRARAASNQQTMPVNVRRPAYRPSLPSLRLAGAALALLLCVAIGLTMVSSLLNPGMPPLIALLTSPRNTSSPSPMANSTDLAQAVNATVVSLLPETTNTQLAQAFPQNTLTQAPPALPSTEEPTVGSTPLVPQVDPTQAQLPEETPTIENAATPVRPPAITGMGTMNLGEQTLNGITITLDWARLDENHLYFQYTVLGLPQEEGLDLRGAVRVTNLSIDGTQADLTGTEHIEQEITSVGDALVIRETREVQHAVAEGAAVDFNIDLTAGGVTLPRNVTATDNSTTTVEGLELPAAGVFTFEVPVPFQPSLRLEPRQISEVNGVRMELKWVRIGHAFTEAGVCFNLPAPGDWQLEGTTTLQIAALAPAALIEQGLDLSRPGFDPTAEPMRRCMHLSFATVYDGATTTAKLSIPALSTPVDFVNRFEEAQVILAKQGIEIEKASVASGFEIRIKRKPSTMTDEEANRRLFEAARQVRQGPWEFIVQVPGR